MGTSELHQTMGVPPSLTTSWMQGYSGTLPLFLIVMDRALAIFSAGKLEKLTEPF